MSHVQTNESPADVYKYNVKSFIIIIIIIISRCGNKTRENNTAADVEEVRVKCSKNHTVKTFFKRL